MTDDELYRLRQVQCGMMRFAQYIVDNDNDINIPFGVFIQLSGAGNILEGVLGKYENREVKEPSGEQSQD